MATIPDPVDVLDFKMKQLCRFRVTDQRYEIQDTSALVATSHLYGLVFVGTPDKVKIIKVADLVQIDNASSKKTEISSYPFKEILLPSRPTFVALSSDNLTLIVCIQKSGCPVGWLYDVRGFARQTGDWNPFQEVRLSSTEGTTVRDCAWNPTTPGLVAVSLSDGSLVGIEIKNTQFTINSLPPSTGAQAISWSPKGKQLVVARPGKLVQYKPDLKEAKTIPFSGSDDVHMSQPAVCGLQWLSTSQFLVTFIDESDPNSRPHLHIVNVQKSGATIFVDYDDVCYGNPSERPHNYLTLGIPQWNVLLACSANAMEVAVLGQTGVGGPEHPEWRQWTLEGECRAELPLDQNDETKPMGMAIDTTSQIPIPWDDNQTLSPVPILFVLSTHGLLCPFHVLNLASGVASVNEPPQQLSAANERPALSGIGLKAAQTVPLAASTPLPSAAKAAIPRTNLGERFAAFAETPSLAAAAKPLPPSGASTESFFANKPPAQSFPPPLTTIKTVQVPSPIVPPIKIAEVSPIVPKPTTPAPVKLTNQTAVEESSSMGAAAAILRDEVAKFVQDLKEFKARSSTLKVSVASDEEKHRLLKMTSELAKFGVELVETTKIQDEEVRGLCTDLDEVAALLEDARVLYARRKNSRYSHLLKLRPLDPANRRKLDGIERLHAHIEQQLVEASCSLDSINRDRTRDQSRKIEIPITQVICEAIKNNAKVISQLKSKVERIKTQSKEQQLKLAGAAFEALRPKASDESRKWESELAVLADSLLTSRIRSDGESQSNHPVIPQVSPEKQAMLRSVLAHRPVARIRAVRPESVAESRLLSNLSGLIHSEDKKDNSFSSTVVSQAPTKSGLFASVGSNVYASSQESKPLLPKMGISSAGLATSVSTASSRMTDPKLAPRAAAAAEVEDITPPSSPLNLEQKAKALGNQQMISSLSLPSFVQSPNVEETKPAISFANVDVKPVVSLPTSLPPPYKPSEPTLSIRPASNPPSYESKPAFSLPTSTPVLSFGTPKSDTQGGLGSANLFGKSSFASVFSSAATTATTTTIAPTLTKTTTLAASSSFAAFGTPVPSSTVPVTPVKPQPTSAVAPTPSFSFANPPAASSTPAASVAIPITTKPTEAIPTLKTSFSFNSLTSASVAPSASPTIVPDPALFQAPTPISTSAVVTTSVTNAVAPLSNFSFSSTSLPSTASFPTAVTAAAPFSFAAPQSSSSTSSAPTNVLETKPAAAAAPTSFSFSLAKTPNSSSTSAPGAAPFSFSPSGTGSTAAASATPSVFAAPNLTPATGSLFSLTSSTKAPTAFGVVNATAPTTPISTSPSTSLFGQVPAATTTPTLFGQPVSATTPATTPDAGLSSLFGQSKLGNSIAAAAPATQSTLGQGVASVASVASTTTPSSTPLFGRPVTTTTGTLFGQPSAATTAGPFSSSFGQGSVFGQSAATSTPANVPVFGQATFGKPVQTTPQTIEVPAASSFGSPAFGQSSGTSTTGFSAGTVFGQGGASTTTPVKPLFGGSAFGQAPTNSAVTSPTSNVGFGSGSVFGNIGLGGTPSAANANRNAFGGGTVFGVTPSAQSTFGSTAVSSPFGGQPAASATTSPPPAFGSPASTGFGAFGQSQPAFGGAATFGGSPQFGSKPTFGGGATFGSPVAASIPAAKPEAGGFGAFAAASNVPTFGVLANSGNAQPAFGGAAFPSNNPPSFGGGSSFSSWR